MGARWPPSKEGEEEQTTPDVCSPSTENLIRNLYSYHAESEQTKLDRGNPYLPPKGDGNAAPVFRKMKAGWKEWMTLETLG